MIDPGDTKRLAIFVSGRGSNFLAIKSAIASGQIDAVIALVVTHDIASPAAEGAAAGGIEVAIYPSPELSDVQLRDLLEARAIDLGILAGYIKLVPAVVIDSFPRRFINIHPAPLPKFGGKGFYGRKVHQAVLASGVKFSGPTVHFVDEAYDHGPVLATEKVPVMADDTPETLAARVLSAEHKLYPQVVAALCNSDLTDAGIERVKLPAMSRGATSL